jgi:hypothetical protein
MPRFRDYDRDFGSRGYGRDYGPPQGRGYDARYARGYDAGWRGGERGHGRRGYDAGYGRGGYGTGYGPDATGWLPFAFTPFAWDPMLGWAGWGGGMGYVPWSGGPGPRPEPRHVDPRQSPAYGRGGDQALRRWAERYGYDFEMTIRPRRGRGG